GGHAHAAAALDQPAEHGGVDGLVLEMLARLVPAFQVLRHVGEAAGVLHQRGNMVAGGDTRVGEVVALLVVHAGAHLHDVTDRHARVAAVTQFGEVVGDGAVQGVD